ncbi:putative Mid2 domain-containing protein [Seiridium unicorne]|uniref:Mid2 domain-containing protein n=1 Tax=Seiridium unicorne TaxID=138068 RepID=A0ABR2VCN4_9PEZI
MRYLLCFLLTIVTRVLADNNFISPKFVDPIGQGSYAGDMVLALGSSQLIAFETSWTAYRIEIWQQFLPAGQATPSSVLVLNQSEGQHLAQSLYWTVQTYELQLASSPVFFFWLLDYNSEAGQTSAYFNITAEQASGSSSSVSSTAVSSTLGASTPTPVTTSTMSSFATAEQPTASRGDIIPTSTSLGGTSGSSGGLSSGAVTGIGVGVSVVGVSALAVAIFMCWNKRRKRVADAQVATPPAYSNNPPQSEYGSYSKNYYPPRPAPLTEIGSNHPRSPVELGG